jgi:hypothetical protein
VKRVHLSGNVLSKHPGEIHEDALGTMLRDAAISEIVVSDNGLMGKQNVDVCRVIGTAGSVHMADLELGAVSVRERAVCLVFLEPIRESYLRVEVA